MEQTEELASVPLNHQDRTGHLPKLLQDVIVRLRLDDDSNASISITARLHGEPRKYAGLQGGVLVEQSRILQVSISGTLRKNVDSIDSQGPSDTWKQRSQTIREHQQVAELAARDSSLGIFNISDAELFCIVHPNHLLPSGSLTQMPSVQIWFPRICFCFCKLPTPPTMRICAAAAIAA